MISLYIYKFVSLYIYRQFDDIIIIIEFRCNVNKISHNARNNIHKKFE